MFGSAIRNLAIAFVIFSSQAFAQLAITTGDSTWSIGRVEWELNATGGSGIGYTWEITDGSLPPGLALRTDIPGHFSLGVTAGIIGVATTPGTYPFTLQVTDSNNETANQTVTMKIIRLVMANDWVFPDASVGVFYSKTINTAGATGPVSFALQAGQNLPDGLELDPATGVISGTPTTPGEYNFWIEISDSTGAIPYIWQIFVSPMQITSPDTLSNATEGEFYSHEISVDGGTPPYNYTINCCKPGWLSLNPANGILSGTPDGSGNFAFTLDISDSAGFHLRKHYQLNVTSPSALLTSLNMGDFEDIPLGEYNSFGLAVSGGTAPYSFSVTSGELPQGMRLRDAPDPRPYSNYVGGWLVGRPIELGTHTFTIQVVDSSLPPRVTSRSYTLHISPLSYDGVPEGIIGTPYSEQIRVLGGVPPFTISMVQGQLPSGLELDAGGLVSGTPTETGNLWSRLLITDSDATPSTLWRGFNISVRTDPGSNIDIQGGDLGSRTATFHLVDCLWAWGGTGNYNWSMEDGALPDGVDISLAQDSNACLDGTPTTIGAYSFRLRAVDIANPSNFAVRTFRLMITPLQLSVSTNLPWVHAGTPYSTTLNVTGNTGAVIWTVEPGNSLPEGLTLSSDGVLTGTPVSPGGFWISIRATDAGSGTFVSWGFTLDVYPEGEYPPLVINTGSDLGISPIGWYWNELQAQGGDGIYTWSVVAGNLPPGILVRTDLSTPPQTSSILAGIATNPGTYGFTLQLADGSGHTATRAFTMRIVGLVMTSDMHFADASIGVFYSKQITTAGANGAVSFALQPGSSLPAGMNLDPATGVISGTPTTPGGFYFTINISDSADTISEGLHVYVSPMRITSPVSLPNAIQGEGYSQAITVEGGIGPYSYTSPCCLPGWLSLDRSNGILSGTPGGSENRGFTIEITDSTGAPLRKHYQIGVVSTPPSYPSLQQMFFESIDLNEYINWQIGTWGGTAPYTWSVTSGALPPGISLESEYVPRPFHNSDGAWLVGRAITSGSYTFTVQATDSSSPPMTTSQRYALYVSPLSRTGVPQGTLNTPYSGQMYVLGGQPPYNIVKAEGDIHTGLTYDNTGLIEGTPVETGNLWSRWFITDSASPANIHFRGYGIYVNTIPPTTVSINNGDLSSVGVNGYVNWNLWASGGSGSYNWSLEPGSELPEGLVLSGTASPYAIVNGTPTVVGNYSFTLRAVDVSDSSNYGLRVFRVAVTPLQLAVSTNLPFGNVGAGYSMPLTVTGNTGAVTWSVEPGPGLPEGMDLAPDGTLSGVPATPGQYWIRIKAADAGTGTSSTWHFSMDVYPAGEFPPLFIDMASDFGISSLGWFWYDLRAQGGDGNYTWSVLSGNLPPGVLIRTDLSTPPQASDLAGVATTPGTYNFTLRVADSSGNTATRAFTAKIIDLVMTSDWEFADASVGVFYSKQITTAGANGAVSFALQPGHSLPAGLNLDPATGVISGTPTTAGDYSFTINISDSTDTISQNLYLYVSPMRITSPASLPNAIQGESYSQEIEVEGGIGPYSYTLHCCTPGGLSLDPASGILSGIAGGVEHRGFTVEIVDSTGARLRRHYQLGVVGTPPSYPVLQQTFFESPELNEYFEWQIGTWGGIPPYTWSVTDGALPPGISLKGFHDPRPYARSDGAWLVGRAIASGSYTFTVQATDSSSPPMAAIQRYTLYVSPLSRGGVPEGTLNVPYSGRIPILGGQPPYNIVKEEGDIHTGLTYDNTGLIEGTPVETGNLWLRWFITDSASPANIHFRGYGIYVNTTPPTTVSINNGDLSSIGVNGYVNWNLWASGGSGSYNWSLEPLSSLPPGLELSGTASPYAIVNGTPTVAGNYSFTLRAVDVNDSNNYGLRVFRVTVTPLQLTVSTNLPFGNVGAGYSIPLTVTGNTGAVTWSIEPGPGLPEGMELAPDGTLSGVPVTPGQYWIRIKAADAGSGTSVTWHFMIDIYPSGQFPPLVITNGTDFGRWRLGRVDVGLQAQGGNGTYTWSLAGGTLPPGIAEPRTDKPSWMSSDASATLTGVATTPGTYNFTLQVTDGSQTVTRAFTVKVYNPTLFDVSDLPEAYVGVNYSYTFTSTYAAKVWSSQPGNPLPPGLVLNPTTGVLSGVPTTAGYFNFSIGDGNDGRGYGMNVRNMWITTPRLLPDAVQGAPYSVNFAVAGSVVGPVTWAANWLPNGLTLLPDGTLTGASTNTGTYQFSVTATDSSSQFYQANFSLKIDGPVPSLLQIGGGATDGLTLGDDYRIGFNVNGGTAPYTWTASGIPPGMCLMDSSPLPPNWNPRSTSIGGVPTVPGTYHVIVTVTDSSSTPKTTSQTFPLNVVAFGQNFDIFPSFATRGQPFHATLRVLGGKLPYTFKPVSDSIPPEYALHAGLTLDGNAGVVSGTPLENGWRCLQAKITDALSAEFFTSYCFGIGGGDTTVNINNGSDLGFITINQSYSQTFNASGAGSYTWSLEAGSTLPDGLTFSPEGVLSGTPTKQGVFSFLIRAADANYAPNYGIRRFIMNVTPLTISVNNPNWRNVGTALSVIPTISGNAGTVIWSLQRGNLLPPGLTLNTSTGEISGTPTSSGQYGFTLNALDPGNDPLNPDDDTWRTVGINFSIYPAGEAPLISLSGIIGRMYSGLADNRGTPPRIFNYAPGATVIPGVRIQTGPLFYWFSVLDDGQLLGWITEAGTYNTKIRMTDSQNQSFDRDVKLVASPIMPLHNWFIPRATVGVPYSYRLKATGGTAPYTFKPAWGMPAGLTLLPDGNIVGTPQSPGSPWVSFEIADAAGNKLSTLLVLDIMPFQILTEGVLPQGTANSYYSVSLVADAAGVSWSMANGNLPGGLSLDQSTGLISGTPNGTAYNSSFTIRATDSGGRSSVKTFTLDIVSSTPQPLSITAPLSYETPVGDMVSWLFTAAGGVPPYEWDLEPGSDPLPPGIEGDDGEDTCNQCAPGLPYLSGHATIVGDYSFTVRVTDSASPPNTITQTFTVHVAPLSIEYTDLPVTGTPLIYGEPYTQEMLGVGGTSLYTWTAESSMPPGLILNPDGTFSGVPAETGGFSTRIRLTDSNGATIMRTVNFNVSSGEAATLNINTGSDLGTMNLGDLWNRDLQASGSPLGTPNYVFSAVGSLPQGCSLTASPGRLTCGITSTGTYTFILRVDDAAGNFGVKTFTLPVATRNVIFTANNGLNNAATGVPFSQQIIVLGLGGTWSIAPGSSLPPGLTLSPDGTISGTPTAVGSYSFTLRLTDANGRTMNQSYSMTIAGLAITDPRIIPVHAFAGEPYTYTFTAQGGGDPKTWSGSGLPAGYSLSSGGVLSGLSTGEGISSFSIAVTDGSTTFTRSFSLISRIKYPLLTSGINRNLDDVVLGLNYQLTLPNAGGIPPYTWSVESGSSLPPGLSLVAGSSLPSNSTPATQTILAGVPSAAGIYTFTLRLTDSTGAYVKRTVTLKVSPLNLSYSFFFPSYGASFSQQLSAYGGTAPYTFSLARGVLPDGLTLAPDGLLSGTISESGFLSFMVRITDSAGNAANRACLMLISVPGSSQTLWFSPAGLISDASLGATFASFTSLGSPSTLSIESGAMPPGISFHLEQGAWILSGRPTTLGLFTARLKIQDNAGNTTYRTYIQRVTPIQILQTPASWSGVAGQPLSMQLKAYGGTPPYSFAVTDEGYFPAGLALNADGTITGTTSETGAFSFQVVVTDSAGNSFKSGRSMRILPAGVSAPLQVNGFSVEGISAYKNWSYPVASVDYNFLVKADIVSGVPPYTLTALSALPPGMMLAGGPGFSTTYITGAPSTAGDFDYDLHLEDSAGQNFNVHAMTKVSPLGLSPNALPPARVGVPYSVTLVPTGGTAPYSVKFELAAPPLGLTFSGNTLSGIPTIAGVHSIILLLRDSSGLEMNRAYTLYIESAEVPMKALSTSPANVQVTVIAGTTPDPIPINIESGVVSVSFTAAFGGIAGATLNIPSNATPQSISLQLPGGLEIGTYYGILEIQAPQAPNSPLAVRVAIKVVAPPSCSFAVSPASATIDANGGTGSLSINTASYCDWTAEVSDSWITLTSPESGSGNGAVSYSLAFNPETTPRTGSIAIDGQVHTVTQFGSECAYTIAPSGASVVAAGGSGSITVHTSLLSCPWTASTADSWIEITSGSSGTGPGSVAINVLENGAAGSRTGSVTIEGLTFTVEQAGAGCIVGLSAGSADFPASGGAGSVNVTTNEGCNYNTVDGPSWITVTSGASGSGFGTVGYSIAPNSTTQTRSGTLLISGQPHQILQAGVGCSFTLNVDTTTFGSSSGTGTISVVPNGSNCGWTSSTSAGFLTITSGWSGRGNGSVGFSLANNDSGLSRSGTITVAGQEVQVTQSGVDCSYGLRSAGGSLPAIGGTSSVGLITPVGCSWNASSDQSWLTVSPSGSGTSEVSYTVQPNSTTSVRTATLTVEGETYAVTQAGVPCSYTLSTSSANVAAIGATGSFTFTALPGCSTEAVSYANWITVTTDPPGTVNFEVAANPLVNTRSGTIQVGDKIFTVKQSAAECSYSLGAYGAIFGKEGGEGSVLVSGSALGCQAPDVGASPELIPLLGPLTQEEISKIWTQIYGAPVYNSFNLWIRVLQISFSGEIFTIKQTSW